MDVLFLHALMWKHDQDTRKSMIPWQETPRRVPKSCHPMSCQTHVYTEIFLYWKHMLLFLHSQLLQPLHVCCTYARHFARKGLCATSKLGTVLAKLNLILGNLIVLMCCTSCTSKEFWACKYIDGDVATEEKSRQAFYWFWTAWQTISESQLKQGKKQTCQAAPSFTYLIPADTLEGKSLFRARLCIRYKEGCPRGISRAAYMKVRLAVNLRTHSTA